MYNYSSKVQVHQTVPECSIQVNILSYFPPLVSLSQPWHTVGHNRRSSALPWDIKIRRVTSKSDELFPIILWVLDCVTISMWESIWRICSLDTSKQKCDVSAVVYEKLYPWWSTSQEDVPLTSQGCDSAAWKLNVHGFLKRLKTRMWPSGIFLMCRSSFGLFFAGCVALQPCIMHHR